jgi:hypothetical protein
VNVYGEGGIHEPRKHPTTNIERPTSNDGSVSASVLGVRCWLLSVGCFIFPSHPPAAPDATVPRLVAESSLCAHV